MMPGLGRALPWILLILFGWRGLLAMRVDGATADEPRHLTYGTRALESGTFLRDKSFNSKMPVSVLNALPVALAGRTASGSRQLFLARLPTLLLGLLLGWLVWRWARDLFGVWSGALALFLYTFCPNFLAHSHLVTTDVATALAMFAAAYAFWRYLERPGRGRLLVLAVVFGAAQLTKVTALFLAPIFVLVLGIRWWREGRIAAREGLAVLLALAGGAVVALNAGFGFEGTLTPLKGYSFVSPSFQSLAATPILRDVPLPLPYAYLQGIDMVSRDSRAETWSYLRGRYSQTGFRSYFLWAFLVKVPLATQLLLLAALWLWGSGRLRSPGAEELLLVPVVFLLLYLSLFFRLDIGFRYALPILPFLFVFTSRVAAVRWGPAVAAPLLLWLAISSLSIHPHYLPYFNELAGGPANGWRWLIDSNLDWNQDDDYMRTVYAPRSPVPVLFKPSGPVAGRVAVNLSNLVGLDPGTAQRNAWLRDNFKPIATIGYSWKVFDVTEADLARCCAGLLRAQVIDDPETDLARAGRPSAGGDGVGVRFQERLNDGMLGASGPTDAARTFPPQPRPVRAWFGIDWPAPRTIGRVVAFPSFGSQGPAARKFLALDYAFQFWDGTEWRDIPGARVTGNQSSRVEHRFAPLRTQRIRLLIERERDERGTEEGGFRAACLEISAYER